MAEFSTADQTFPEQWGRLLRDPLTTKWAWGHWRPSQTVMQGWHTQDFSNEISVLQNRLSYWLGRIPTGKSDGFNEVRVCWVQKKIDYLEEQKDRLEVNTIQEEEKEYREGPTSLLSVSTTKRGREPEASGDGYLTKLGESVNAPSHIVASPPSLAAKKPYVPPRKRQRKAREEKEEEQEDEVPGTPEFASPTSPSLFCSDSPIVVIGDEDTILN